MAKAEAAAGRKAINIHLSLRPARLPENKVCSSGATVQAVSSGRGEKMKSLSLATPSPQPPGLFSLGWGRLSLRGG